MKKFADEALDGLIVFSLGSYVSKAPMKMVLKVLETLAPLKQRLVMRLDSEYAAKIKEISKLPDNVMFVNWLPQNELLAHQNTILFISHCGNFGRSEALFHGVPILAIPIFGDQWGHANQIAERGFGLKVDYLDFQDKFEEILLHMLQNDSFGKAILKASKIFHSRTPPSKKAADAIEHVLKFGSNHLRPHAAYQLNIWQIFMADIFLFLYILLCSVVLASVYCIWAIGKWLLKKRGMRRKISSKDKAKSQ